MLMELKVTKMLHESQKTEYTLLEVEMLKTNVALSKNNVGNIKNPAYGINNRAQLLEDAVSF